jgi:hypothetical protein
MAIFPLALRLRPPQQYSFGLAAAPPHGNISFGLAATPRHGNISSGLVALPPHGDISFASHGGNQFSLCLTAIIDFIPSTWQFAPHGNIDFLFASR